MGTDLTLFTLQARSWEVDCRLRRRRRVMDIMSTAIRIGVLGLTVTFAALLVLRLIIGMLARFTAQPVSDQHAPKLSKKEDTVGAASANRAETPNDDNVPAIIAVLAAMGATPKPGGQIHIEEIPG